MQENALSPQPEEWKERDELFKRFTHSLYDGHLSESLVEKLRQHKIEGAAVPKMDTAVFVAKMLIHRITPLRQQAKAEQILSVLDADEREVLETAIGFNYCGITLDRSQTAAQTNHTPEEVDVFLRSAYDKLPASHNT